MIARDERVVVVSTAHGLKFAEQKVAYHAGKLAGIDAARKNPPIVLPAALGPVVDTLRARLGLA